ncbi:hypothetical protein SteCoe_37884 [Stentor coeruleus]|uniref:PKD/REJ-like domain-containing protein n=1 Tax=Stentor coeruleus TaxID=5963 RepID=A0A1R2AM90_9CILI|nr:hypothetical protein SteCoe_37884 [Stentor coeruleus]
MILEFDSILNGNEYNIELDSSLTPVNEKCRDQINFLNLTIPSIELPMPELSLDGPTLHHLHCGNESILVFNRLDSSEYIYNWTANPLSTKLGEYLSTVNTSKIDIPNSLLQNGDLVITCKAMILIYNASVTESLTITVSSSDYLEVEFNTPTKVSIKKSEVFFTKGYIGFICGENGQATYKWEYLSSNPLDFNTLLSNNPEPNGLLIPENTLEVDKEYSFKFTITVASSSISGSNIIEIQVIPTDLQIALSKTPGIISKTQDLVIEATVVDADSPSAEIKYEWKCLEESEPCKSDTLETLEFEGNTNTVIVAKDSLRSGAYYMFSVTASTSNKENIASVELYVDNLAQGELSIKSNDKDLHENIDFEGIVTGIINAKFSWDIEPKLSNNFQRKYSFLSIPRNYLKENTVYNISLTATPASRNPLKTYILVVQPPAPKCSILSTTFLLSNWFVTVGPCVSDSYSLIYEFGCYTDKNSSLWLTSKSFINEGYILIPNKCDIIFAKVCNGISCTIVDDYIPDGNKVHDNIISDYNMDLLNGIKTPNAIIYYSLLISTQDEWSEFMTKMDTFYRSQTEYESLVNVLISSLNSMILKIKLMTSKNADFIYKFTEYILIKFKPVLTSSNLIEIFTYLGKLQTILDLNSASQILKKTIDFYFENALPGNEPLIISSEILIYAARTTADSLAGSNIEINSNALEIPDTIKLESGAVYDTEYIIYPPSNNEVMFEVSFYTSGTYMDYKLSIDESKSVNLNSEIIYATVQGDFSASKSYECSYLESDNTWIINGCKVEKSSSTDIKINLLHQSIFKVYEIASNGTCELGLGPIIASCAWIFIVIFAVIIFSIMDKNQEENLQQTNKYTAYAFTSIFIRQNKGNRIWAIIYLLSVHMLFIFLIGVFFLNFTTPQDKSDNNFGLLSIENIYSGMLAWGITQIIAFPIYYYIFNKHVLIKKANFAKYTALSLSIVCIVGIVAMTILYCKQYTYYWVINYFVFLPVQMIVEILFAVIVWKRQKNQIAFQSIKVFPDVAEVNKSRINEDEFQAFKKSTRSQASIIVEKFPNSGLSEISLFN